MFSCMDPKQEYTHAHFDFKHAGSYITWGFSTTAQTQSETQRGLTPEGLRACELQRVVVPHRHVTLRFCKKRGGKRGMKNDCSHMQNKSTKQ